MPSVARWFRGKSGCSPVFSGFSFGVIRCLWAPPLLSVANAQARTGPKITHGPLTLDTAARRAYLGGQPLDLAGREWAVLEVLLARVERIASKESIIQSVASWGEELSPNAIEVYVSRLRSKLEPAGIRIRTVRGFGYMLEEFKETGEAPVAQQAE